MKITINTDDPAKLESAIRVARMFIRDHLPNGDRLKHRDCAFYALNVAPPFPYEFHVWGTKEHVRVWHYTRTEDEQSTPTT